MRIRFPNFVLSIRKIPKGRTRFPKQGASFVGLYEKPMLDFCISEMKEVEKVMIKSPDERLQLLLNMLIESFLIHARNVRYFLFNRPSNWNDDIVAVEYLPSWKKKIKKECKFLHSKRAQIDRSALHLSYSRIDYERKGKLTISDCINIYGELDAVWLEFWKNLTAEKRKWFQERNISDEVV